MEHLDTYQQSIHAKNRKGVARPPHETLKDTLNELIQCQKEITALNKKLFSLCKNDKELHWLKSRGLLNFPED